MILIFIAVLGLVFGSFITALTYRIVRGVSTAQGRSFCDNCREPIMWYDNIPLFSYLILNGRCRVCRKPISPRYPAIEFFTSLTFLTVYISVHSCIYGERFFDITGSSPICTISHLGYIPTLIYLCAVTVILISVFVIDLENFIIPDEMVATLGSIAFFTGFIFNGKEPFGNMVAGFALSLSFLFLHAVTAGKGMGLGDVKLAIPLGIFLGLRYIPVFFVLSFMVGGIWGVYLLASGKKGIKSAVPFGPFLIVSFFAVLIFGDIISSWAGF